MDSGGGQSQRADIFRQAAKLAAERPEELVTEAMHHRLQLETSRSLRKNETRPPGMSSRAPESVTPSLAAPPFDRFGLAGTHLWEGLGQLMLGCGDWICNTCCCPPRFDKDGGGLVIEDEDSDDDEEEQLRKIVRAAGVILPTDPWKEKWDVGVLLLIIYSAIAVPYRICFDAPAQGVLWYFEQVLTAAFMIDVFFNFKTAHTDNNQAWVLDRREIIARYLSGWFWIDFPSCVPVELLDYMMAGEQTEFGLLRFLRLFRLIRLLRLLKVQHYVATLEEKLDLNLNFLRIITMVVNLLFLSHILACFWFYMASVSGISDDVETWVSHYDHGSGVGADASVQYLYSMYWALTTLTTVSPCTPPDLLLSPARIACKERDESSAFRLLLPFSANRQTAQHRILTSCFRIRVCPAAAAAYAGGIR
jgi:hypothetical protein